MCARSWIALAVRVGVGMATQGRCPGYVVWPLWGVEDQPLKARAREVRRADWIALAGFLCWFP